MGKFVMTICLISCIFLAGVFFGNTLNESISSASETERAENSLRIAYEDWKEDLDERPSTLTESQTFEQSDLYSEMGKSFSSLVKKISRLIVFQTLSIVEKIMK